MWKLNAITSDMTQAHLRLDMLSRDLMLILHFDKNISPRRLRHGR